MGRSSVIEPTNVGERVVAFLRRMHPSKTAAMVAAETGCSIDQVEKWIERANVPNGTAMLRLFLRYGPPFLIAVADNPPKWLDAAHRSARLDRIEADLARLRADIAT